MKINTHDLLIDEMDWQELNELWTFHKEREMNREPKHQIRTKQDIKSERVFLKEHIREMTQYLSGSNKETREFVLDSITISNVEIKRLERNLNYINSQNTGISRGKIEQAKRYPIENLIEVKRGMAKCINHNDRHPSMDCRGNWVYCHACHWSGDAISVYMKLNNCDFNKAVNDLVNESR